LSIHLEIAHNVGRLFLAMTPEERDRMNQLCRQIETEQDPIIFSKLVNELDQLLRTKEQRIEARQQKPQSS
jgi:hypothetical protein